MTTPLRAFYVGAIVALATACDETIDPPPASDLTGLWDWTASRVWVTSGGGTTCSDTGSVNLSRVDGAYVGPSYWVGSCDGPDGAWSYAANDSLASVFVSDSMITFIRLSRITGAVLCHDTVSTIGDAPDELVGTSQCTTTRAAWRAIRGRPLGSVTILPAELVLPQASTRLLGIDLRTSTGARVFGRPVAWSTDNPAVLTVDTTGLVFAVAAGTASISATAEGHTDALGVVVLAPTTFASVTAGNAFSCGLGAGGYAYCWGIGVSTPRPVPAPASFVSLAGGFGSSESGSCALATDGVPYCWTRFDAVAPVSGGPAFASLTAGGEHACGLTATGAAWCWGSASFGQLGHGSTTASASPVAVVGSIAFTTLSAGISHTCGIAGGTLYCWGANSAGQLGDGTTTTRSSPVPVAGTMTWTSVSAGGAHTCAVTTANVGYCWGEGGASQLGNGTTSASLTPAAVSGGHQFTTMAAGLIHSCGIDTGGAAWCWGVNAWGQLGNGIWGEPSATPVPVSGGLTFGAITTGSYLYSDEHINPITAAHTCATTSGGVTYCWGVNNIGQIGNGERSFVAVVSPVKVAGQP